MDHAMLVFYRLPLFHVYGYLNTWYEHRKKTMHPICATLTCIQNNIMIWKWYNKLGLYNFFVFFSSYFLFPQIKKIFKFNSYLWDIQWFSTEIIRYSEVKKSYYQGHGRFNGCAQLVNFYINLYPILNSNLGISLLVRSSALKYLF